MRETSKLQKKRPIVNGGITRVPIGWGLFAIIDTSDLPLIRPHKWSVKQSTPTSSVYAKTGYGHQMHRVIMGVVGRRGVLVDHINGDTLDNRRCNLRLCDATDNVRNQRPQARGKSEYKGVSWAKQQGKWRAKIFFNGKTLHLGYFAIEKEAALAYDRAAREYFQNFAWLNFPNEGIVKF